MAVTAGSPPPRVLGPTGHQAHPPCPRLLPGFPLEDKQLSDSRGHVSRSASLASRAVLAHSGRSENGCNGTQCETGLQKPRGSQQGIIPRSACFLAPHQVALSRLQGLGPLLPCCWGQDWSKGCAGGVGPFGAPLRGVCEPAPLLRAPHIHPKSVAQGVQRPDSPLGPTAVTSGTGVVQARLQCACASLRGPLQAAVAVPEVADGAHRACQPGPWNPSLLLSEPHRRPLRHRPQAPWHLGVHLSLSPRRGAHWGMGLSPVGLRVPSACPLARAVTTGDKQ